MFTFEMLCCVVSSLPVHPSPHPLQETDVDECCHQGRPAAQLQARRRALGTGDPSKVVCGI